MFVERLEFELLFLQTMILDIDLKPLFEFSVLVIYNNVKNLQVGLESVMKMGVETRELFFYETFLYYNPLLLIVSYFSALKLVKSNCFKCVSSCMLFCSDTDGLALGC